MEEQTKSGWWRLFSVDLLIAAALCLLSVFAFAFIANEIVMGKQDFFDSAAFQFFEAHTSPANTRIALFITFLGSGTFLFPAYLLIVLFLLKKKRKKQAVVIGAITAVSFLLNIVLKNVFQRDRPLLLHLDEVSGYSFPSGHSMGAFTFSGIMIAVVWLTKNKIGTKLLFSFLLFILACLIGLSRIYLHVHYASDVIGGFCITVMWLSICFMYFTWGEKRWFV
jgi:undecaprenyl-diphosphatase